MTLHRGVLALVARWSIAVVLLAAGCSVGSRPNSSRLDYYLAVIENDTFGVETETCNVTTAAQTLTYRYPDGSPVTVRASRDPLLSLLLDDSVNIRLLDFTGAELAEVRTVIAEVIPAKSALEEAAAVRSSLLRCNFLITLDGKAVGIEGRGRDWSRQLPGGRFSSLEAAKDAFSRSRASVGSEVPVAEVKAQEDFWRWRRQRDLWDYHCDSTIRETIRKKNPELFDALNQTPTPDCQSPPIMPEEADPIEEE